MTKSDIADYRTLEQWAAAQIPLASQFYRGPRRIGNQKIVTGDTPRAAATALVDWIKSALNRRKRTPTAIAWICRPEVIRCHSGPGWQAYARFIFLDEVENTP